jgi:multidrug efflux pump subunit AcrA (membrane-fusion protein)
MQQRSNVSMAAAPRAAAPDLNDDLAALRIAREPHRRTRRRRAGWLLLLIGVTSAGVFAAWQWATRVKPVEVETAVVSERPAGTQAAILNATGYVTARRRATVSSKITGKLIEVNVEEGMAVRQGEVLARLDDAALRAARALAEAQVAAARRGVRENEVRLHEAQLTLTRLTRLVAEGVSSQSDLEAAQAQVDTFDARILAAREQVRVAEQQVALATTNLDDAIIRAPFTIRDSCRGARSSASASRERSSPTRRCCCAMNRPAISIARRATRFSICCKR